MAKSPYLNEDGTFIGGFQGCVDHFVETEGLAEENARRLCAYIGRRAGKIPNSAGANAEPGWMMEMEESDGSEPPAWVTDRDEWDRAKTEAAEEYDEDEEGFWAAMVAIYKRMGGRVGGAGAANGAGRDYRLDTVLTGANEAELTREGRLVIPFGDYPVRMELDGRQETVIQRLDEDSANAMSRDFRSLLQRAKRLVAGAIPVYVGHPDVPELADQYADRRAYGWLRSMSVAEGTLELGVDWNQAGRELVENRYYRWPSPRWEMELDGTENGRPVARPRRLLSVGMTNTPNITTAPAVNTNNFGSARGGSENETMEVQMDKRLMYLLRLLGLTEEATEQETEEAATTRLAGNNDLATARQKAVTDLVNERAAWAATKAGLEGRIAGDETKLAAANQATKAERKLRIDLVLAQAVAAGKITPADKPQWASEMEASNEGFARLDQLAAGKALKTTSRTDRLGQRRSERVMADGRIGTIVAAVNEKRKQTGLAWDAAFAAVRREQPRLFEQQ